MDRIHLFAFCHGFFEGKAVIIKLMNGVKKLLIGNLLLFKNHAVFLFFEGTGIQDLVTTACMADSGIRRLGLWRALISQIALAPAREITTSARAKRSGSSSLIYSY